MSNTPDGIHERTPQKPSAELYESFTQSVRDLADATLRTNGDTALLQAAEAEIRAITARLVADQIPGTHGEHCPSGGMVGSWGNAVVGLRNPVAMPLRFEYSEERIWAEFTPGALYEGPPGHMHGGIIALLLDQVLGELSAHLKKPGLTANLSVDYSMPTKLNQTLKIEAWLDRVDGFKTWTKGTISTADGTVCATGTGLFILPRWLREKAAEDFTDVGKQA